MLHINNSCICRVMLQGGPVSGKTTILEELKKRVVPNSHVGVAWISEAATYLLNSDQPIVNATALQEIISLLYQQWESEAVTLLVKNGFEQAFVVQDRGITDAFVYPHDASELITSDLQSAFHRYDYVFFLETLDRPQVKDIKSGNELRMESSFEEIKEIEKRSFNLYSQHPNFIYVSNMDIDSRTDFIGKKLNQIFSTTLFKMTSEMKRR